MVVTTKRLGGEHGLDFAYDNLGGLQHYLWISQLSTENMHPNGVNIRTMTFIGVQYPPHMNKAYIPARIVNDLKEINLTGFTALSNLRTGDSSQRYYSRFDEYIWPQQ